MNKLLKLFNRSSLVIKFSVIAVLLIVIYMLFFKKYSLESFGNPTSCTYYYMENCGHCKRFSPEWDKFESAYEGPVQLRKLEMNEAGDDLQKYKIIRENLTIALQSTCNRVESPPDSQFAISSQ